MIGKKEVTPAGPSVLQSTALTKRFEEAFIAAGKAGEHFQAEAAEFAAAYSHQSSRLSGLSDLPTNALLDEWVTKRLEGTPIPFITGLSLFDGEWFVVKPCTLAPHPATSVLIELCRDWLSRLPAGQRTGIEVGIGCGVISVCLLKSRSDLKMLASDRDVEILEIARQNGDSILAEGACRLELLECRHDADLFEPFHEVLRTDTGLDMIVSNPPYLEALDEISSEYRNHMPATALYGPAHDPLYFYRSIAIEGSQRLRHGGQVFVEAPTARSDQIAGVFRYHGFDVSVFSKSDLAAKIDLTGLPKKASQRQFANHRYIVAKKT